jgi:hypothetical protein
MEVLHVQDPSQLSDLNQLLHDQPFRISWLRYDPDRRCLSLPVGIQQPPEERPRWWHFFFWREKLPLIEHEFEFRQVRSHTVDDRSSIEQYTFGWARYHESEGRLTLESNEDLTISMEIDRLDIIVSDRGRQIGTRTASAILMCVGDFDTLLDRSEERESSD